MSDSSPAATMYTPSTVAPRGMRYRSRARAAGRIAAASTSDMKRMNQICGVWTMSQIAATTPTTWKTSGHGSRDGMSGTGDDLRRHEPVDLLARHAELREDLLRVLTEPRRGPADRGGRRGRPRGKSEHARGAQPGLLELRDEPQVPHLRVLEHLVELVDRARGDLSLLHALHPLGRGG